MTKVMLVLIDGMRPDSLPAVDHPFYHELLKTSRYSLRMQTVMPSVTLPCHMSLFHSVTPERHGILTNTYVPQVRPVNGLSSFDRPGRFHQRPPQRLRRRRPRHDRPRGEDAERG